jgi:hypothetical protein
VTVVEVSGGGGVFRDLLADRRMAVRSSRYLLPCY